MIKNLIKQTLVKIDSLHLPSQTETKFLKVPFISGNQGNCGIASASMLIKYYGGNITTNEDEWNSFKNDSTYIKDIGWKHTGLKRIIESNSNTKVRIFKYKSMNFVLKNLAEQKPVIVSVLVPTSNNLDSKSVYASINSTIKPERHMVICIGFDKSNIIVHDPRNIGIYTESLKIPKEIFKKIFNGNGIL